ncbi:MAG: 4Fe-4S dicluster domain-containing protein [Kofleriaceae bacterium]|nr:Fe-S-cluster-containing hydrogenase [Myxococcales bacterium]MCB9559304.1 4Fe-4S dicluster domain-containing protein [Kofleriaceae bacterium]
MSSLNDTNQPGDGTWRSLDELERGGELAPGAEHEFPETSADSQVADPMSRRNFAKLMGASMALVGVAGAGCKRYEKEEIVPLARRPEDEVPGVPRYYATAWDFAGFGQALVATSFEGRPIKVDGNAAHPFAGGGTVIGTERHGSSSPLAQATILEMYDPDRSRTVLKDGAGATIEDFRAWLDGERANLRSRGGRVRILSEATSSPTVARMRAEVAQSLPGARWVDWEPVSFDNERAGLRAAFGKPVRPLPHLDRARTVVVLDGDIFVEHPAALRMSRDWARARRLERSSLGEGVMGRLYSIESTFTSTGAVADHRLPLRSELILPFAMALEAKLSGGAGPGAEFLAEDKIAHFLDVMAEELAGNRGRAIVIAGRRQPAAVHALVAKINFALGAVGSTVEYLEDPEPQRPDHLEGLVRLTRELHDKQVDYLFILGANPVYDAPADLDFAGALANVQTSVHLSQWEDETSKKTTWHVPRSHYLEAWNDVRTYDGTITLAQPLIEPMYASVSILEMLQLLTGSEPDGFAAVKATFDELRPSVTWRAALHDGFVPGTALPVATGIAVNQLPPMTLTDSQKGGTRVANGNLEVVWAPSMQLWDGRFANNVWLQETPDFLTKVTWDNYAMVGPSTAKDLGLKNDSLIKVKVGDREMEVACYTMPGQAPYSVTLVLGGGRTSAGRHGGDGKDKRGFDTYQVRASAAHDMAAGCTVTATGKSFQLASVQEHWDIRAPLKKDVAQWGIKNRLPMLVRETTHDEIKDAKWRAEEDPAFPLVSLFKEKTGEDGYPEDKVHAWAMAIDLGTCTGCNACMVACQSENNVPVVGKTNVMMKREMHWIRIDRYFSGSPDDPEIVHQPIGCVHCENAPCEQVCPVGATLHTSEGLNDMIYNRCIGTRYCLNNCTYRVRRFNFFDYNKEYREARNKVRRLLFNPEVTVRHRGVMEKCTYCVQRIQNAKINAKNERRELVDGEIVTACQAACPTEAIVFGDRNDPKSRVRRLHEDRRAYSLLNDEYNTKPRTRHLARVRNPNPKLESTGSHDHRGSH